MHKAKWNYTEDITYRVVMVKLLPVEMPLLHWQKAWANEIVQAVEVTGRGDKPFLILNEDGSGLLKIERGGGPDSGSWHIKDYELINEVTDQSKWIQYSEDKYAAARDKTDNFLKEKYPIEFERMLGLRAMAMGQRKANMEGKGAEFMMANMAKKIN